MPTFGEIQDATRKPLRELEELLSAGHRDGFGTGELRKAQALAKRAQEALGSFVSCRQEIPPHPAEVGFAFYQMERDGAMNVEVEIRAPLWELVALLGPEQEGTVYLTPEEAQILGPAGATISLGWIHRAQPTMAIVRRPETPETGPWPGAQERRPA